MEKFERDVLFEKYTPKVKVIAYKMWRDKLSSLPLLTCDDVEQFAYLGLLDALEKSIDRYSEQEFKSYLGVRVKGAIIDGIRATTIKRNDYARGVFEFSLNEWMEDENGKECLPSLCVEKLSAPFGNDLEEKEKKDLVQLILKEAHLTSKELEILAMLYFYNMTNGKVGKVYNLTESRISQLHTIILAKLQKASIRLKEIQWH